MQKRVHFAPTNTVFSSRTPSPTLSAEDLSSSSSSSSSASDSSSVSTPPPEVEYEQQQRQQQYHYPQSPFPHPHEVVPIHYYGSHNNNTPPFHQYHHQMIHPHDMLAVPTKSPSPPQQQHMNIHLLLAYHPETDIPLRYDLSNGFITSHITNEDLLAAATEPPLSSLIIICPYLAWEIHVAPSPSPTTLSPYSPDGIISQFSDQQRDYVTVYDILRCLHRSLRQVVTPEEYDTLAPQGPSRESVDSTYHSRISKIEDMIKRSRDEKYGIRRIDFLQGMNMFRGLAGTMVGPNVWELNVALPQALPQTMMGGGFAPVMAIAPSAASVL